MVYCATVPNGTLYCRENGYAFWSGNTWLWWEQPQSAAAYQTLRRHIQNELEGQAKISIIGGVKKPEVIEVNPVQIGDLLIEWQEMLIRMIANAFDMSAMALGVEHDVNRAVGTVLDDKDFRSAVVPCLKRLQEAFSRKILHEALGWNDLEFVFLSLDDPDIETKLTLYKGLYAVNAATPNRILKAMNMPELDSPFADLTQMEAMLVMQQAGIAQQDTLADHSVNRQMAVSQMQQQMLPPPDGPSGPGGGSLPPQGQQPQTGQAGGTQGGSGKAGQYGQPPNPKPLALPKFPMTGSAIYSARQVARMPLNQFTEFITATGLTPVQIAAAMEEQEPGILETLGGDVKEYLEQRVLEQTQIKNKKLVTPKILKAWLVELRKKYNQQNKRTLDMAEFLSKNKSMGKPGKANLAGKPGNKYPTGGGGGRSMV